MRRIKVGNKFVKLDKDFYPFLARFNWVLDNDGYARTVFKSKFVRMHEFVCLPTPNRVVDHLNFDKLDNRRSNLELTTNHKNLMRSKSRMRKDLGVSKFHITDQWRARITRGGKEIHLGLFNTKRDAIKARNEWIKNDTYRDA